nr:hypothetical protein Iba_chr15eCG4010 [Ipomoea batatas]
MRNPVQSEPMGFLVVGLTDIVNSQFLSAVLNEVMGADIGCRAQKIMINRHRRNKNRGTGQSQATAMKVGMGRIIKKDQEKEEKCTDLKAAAARDPSKITLLELTRTPRIRHSSGKARLAEGCSVHKACINEEKRKQINERLENLAEPCP